MTHIIPAIIPYSYDELAGKAGQVKGVVRRLQVDVLDGQYTETPASWPYNDSDAQAWQNLVEQREGLPYWETIDYEIDLMVKAPEEKIEQWINAGASALIVHLESSEHIDDVIKHAKERGVEVGVALKPSTDIERLVPWIEQIDFIQCMGNDTIGAQGLALDPRVVGKIEDIRTRFPNSMIGVDIGVTEETASSLLHAGATRLVSGSTIFMSDNVREAIGRLENIQ